MNQFQNYLLSSFLNFYPVVSLRWFRISLVILNLIQNLYWFRVEPGMTERTPGRDSHAASRGNSHPT